MGAQPLLYSGSSKLYLSYINFLCCQKNSSPPAADYRLASGCPWCPPVLFPPPSSSPPTECWGSGSRVRGSAWVQRALAEATAVFRATWAFCKEGVEERRRERGSFPSSLEHHAGGSRLPRALPLLVQQLAQRFLMLTTVNHMLSAPV